MNDLAQKVIDAHGGLDRWKRFGKATAHLKQGGALWSLKGHAAQLDDVNLTVGLGAQWASHSPFSADGRISHFKPDLVTITDSAGKVVEKLDQPRASFAGHTLETPWSDPQLAYFAGIAMWTYINMPFVLAAPGVETTEIDNWTENGETWQRLRVTFPSNIATHSTIQTLYVDSSGLLKRHDYDVEIAGNTPGAHYISDYIDIDGIKFPKRRRIFPRQPDGNSLPEPLVVSIDLSDIRLS
ncbi:hypothetical protein MRS76_00075 [Rhizobiaceae bacterium n13]|uniref:Uncharacterized protein n=1 Tax=Ferirhizobium litorale TaxID=2927786 RepID=A0AAE3U1Z6_9HYPH|nr:hypothetical protein [Fererhizobium litorale]MDI7860339.1 hypothetical protein [Fererhizobium litorale]MDI7920474.1 hypothetical protein [Fererhizobium litorale]